MEGKITGAFLPAYQRLTATLRKYGSLAIAFSGGTDSTFLLYVAHNILKENAKAFTADTDYMVRDEISEAEKFCNQHGIPHEVIRIRFPEDIRNNPPDRCYICKKNIFSQLTSIATVQGFAFLADGSHTGDLNEFRPGRKALRELAIRSPLMEAGLSKTEIRAMSRMLGLPNWNHPPNACLLTRLPHNHKIDLSLLPHIEAGENVIRKMGFTHVRLRMKPTGVTIEVAGDEVHRFKEEQLQHSLFNRLKKLGFTQLSIDPEGYRTGNMNPKTQTSKP